MQNQLPPVTTQTNSTQTTNTQQETPAIASTINPNLLVKNGDSPTAIILSVAVLIAIVFSSLTPLLLVLRQTQPPQPPSNP